ncbi:MAG: xanthine dehydrogenase accessory protein XdhC [Deltaproteobacteria bacterium]|nr:xanthine dehydrogenase accessory protein XdhC [Deltaproteobacteria bacterium]
MPPPTSTDPAKNSATWPLDGEAQRLLLRLPELVPQGARPATLVTVFATQGSAPRRPGARMLCRDGKLLAGTIGGGHLEDQALRDAAGLSTIGSSDADAPPAAASEYAEEADPHGSPRRLCRYNLGPKLAQCCGGVVWLHFAEVSAERGRELAQQVRGALDEGAQVITRFGDTELIEIPQPPTTVIVFGAGHVSAALSRVLQPLPWRVLVVDPRPEWARTERFAPGTDVLCADPLRLLAAWGWLGPDAKASQTAARLKQTVRASLGRELPEPPVPEVAHALVMTWDHALDRDLVEALLRAPEAQGQPDRPLAYVGLIGSKSKIAATRQRLRARGVSDGQLARLTAPIGLLVDGRPIGGNLPGEIAVSVAAQLLSLQHRLPAPAPVAADD